VSASKRRSEKMAKAAKGPDALDRVKAKDAADAKTEAFIRKCCGNHLKQLAFVIASLQEGARVAAAGGRQAGKSRGACTVALELLGRSPDLQGIWIGLSAEAVRTTTWPSIKRYLREWGLLDNDAPDAPPQVTITERPATVTLANKSRLILLGTDDARHIESFRGATNALVILDEIQSQPYELIQGLVEDVLEPSLVVSDGPLIVLGTPPRKKVGYFATVWERGSFDRHHFTGADNPATAAKFQKHVERIAASRGVDWKKDPRIRREWFGEWEDDQTNAVLPNFTAATNLYKLPEPKDDKDSPKYVRYPYGFHLLMTPDGPVGLPGGRWFFAMGIDSGQRDRLAIEVLAWCDSDPRVWQVAEYCAPKGHKSPASVWVPYVKQYIALYGGMEIFLDPSSISVSTLQIDYHVPAAKAAIKTEREGQIGRFNDLCARGLMKIVEGSALAEDAIKAEWDPSNDSEGRRHYSKAHKIDPLDAARYALAGYWNLAKPEDTRTADQKADDDRRTRIKELVEASHRRYGPPADSYGSEAPGEDWR
jgi:hypothetical protein